ncbi:LVIVD repeat-containing protein [Hydrocarboniphaga sp.]|uniref:LVIVD repeat-containing protein n=1 Tax=Hydrocarboniphaga sp. TaxID=2033016 RepID=UPI003D12DAB3
MDAHRLRVTAAASLLALAAAGCGSGSPSAPVVVPSSAATPKAQCGAGSQPETGMQGRVSQADHDSGRAAQGYTCNTELVGSYTKANVIGSVGGFKVERYIDPAGHECAYYDTTILFPTNVLDANVGVNVIDMSDPTQPQLTARLITPAMLSPHESLVVSQQAGILAAVMGNPALYPGIVDVYDLSADCRHPKLRSSALVGVFGHESGLAPDGRTFYSSSPGTPTLTAVDIADPSRPKMLKVTDYKSHGLSISDDGNRAYIASGINTDTGLVVLDVSEIQARKPDPEVHEIARLDWGNRSIPQNAIPFTRNGKPYLLDIDEFSVTETGKFIPAANGAVVGAARIIDISDETQPFVASEIRLEVHQPENRAALADDPGASSLLSGYAGHYCNVPSRVDPPIVACSMLLSGLRVFDIHDPLKPREIAYFNAPVQPRLLPIPAAASNQALSSPAFAPERKEIWYTDAYSGLYVVRVTNGVW